VERGRSVQDRTHVHEASPSLATLSIAHTQDRQGASTGASAGTEETSAGSPQCSHQDTVVASQGP
jgi:hypothetical protein